MQAATGRDRTLVWRLGSTVRVGAAIAACLKADDEVICIGTLLAFDKRVLEKAAFEIIVLVEELTATLCVAGIALRVANDCVAKRALALQLRHFLARLLAFVASAAARTAIDIGIVETVANVVVAAVVAGIEDRLSDRLGRVARNALAKRDVLARQFIVALSGHATAAEIRVL